jgi:hypothetical protein
MSTCCGVYTHSCDFWAGDTIKISALISDADNVAIPAGSFSALTLSLHGSASGAPVNNFTNIDVLNNNRGSFDVSGNFVVRIGAPNTADTAIANPVNAKESRSAILTWTYNGGEQGHYVFNFTVAALP